MIPSPAVIAAALLAAADPAPVQVPAASTAASTAPAPAPDAVEEVQVTAGRAPVVGDLQKGVLNYRPEFFTPVRPSTAMDMVNWLPGFTFEDTRDMRGLEGSTGNVLIDGKPPTSKTDTLYSVLRRIPADQVERIDIVVGGAPGVDMHGRAIIANVILKPGSKQRLFSLWSYTDTHGRVSSSALLTSSEKHDGKVIEGSIEVGRNFGIASSYGYGPWERRDGAGAVVFTANTHFLIGGPYLRGSAAYEFPFAAGALRLNVSVNYSAPDTTETDVLTSATDVYGFAEKDLYKQLELGLHYERKLGPATFETQLLERFIRYDTQNDDSRPPRPSFFSQNSEQQESALRTALKFKKDDTFNLEAFAEGAFNGQDSRNAQSLSGVAQVLPVAHANVTERRGEAGVTGSWKPNPRFGIDTTLKLEASDIASAGDVVLDHKLVYWKPRIQLGWAPSKDTQLRLRVEREVQQIFFGNFITSSEYNSGQLRVGNPGLRPQRDWAAEAVLERHFWNDAVLTLTVRRLALQDVVDVAAISTAAGPFGEIANIGDGRQTDFVADLTLPLKRLGLDNVMIRGKVTASRQQVRDPVSGAERPFSGESELLGEFHFAQDFPKWKVNWGLDAYYGGGATLYRPFGNEEFSAWPRMNIFADYKIMPRLVMHVEVQNLPGVRTRQTISVFTGLRDRSALRYVDIQRLSAGPVLFLRMRRNF